jgi:hypothetical protein
MYRLLLLREPCATHRPAEVVAAHFDHDVHFGEARTHAFADAISERLFAHGALSGSGCQDEKTEVLIGVAIR